MFSKKQFAHIYDVNDFNELKIDLTSTDLVITQGETSGIIFYDEKNNHDRLDFKQEGSLVTIQEKRGIKNLKYSLEFKFLVGKRRLEITLPKQKFNKIFANVGSGDVAVSDVNVTDMKLRTKSGAVTLAYSQFDKLNLNLQDSNLVMKTNNIQRLNLQNHSGNVVLDQITLEDQIIAEIDEGDLKLHKTTVNDGLVTLGSGDVLVRDFKCVGDFKLTTDVGNLSLKQIETPTITVAAVRGNDLKNPTNIQDLPKHKMGQVGATFLTTAGYFDVRDVVTEVRDSAE